MVFRFPRYLFLTKVAGVKTLSIVFLVIGIKKLSVSLTLDKSTKSASKGNVPIR